MLFRAHRETSESSRPKLVKGSGDGGSDGDEEFGATIGTPKSSKFSSTSGSNIVRGSTSTGSVSASSWERAAGGTLLLSSSDAADAATEERSGERRRREVEFEFDEDDEDQVDVERQRRR